MGGAYCVPVFPLCYRLGLPRHCLDDPVDLGFLVCGWLLAVGAVPDQIWCVHFYKRILTSKNLIYTCVSDIIKLESIIDINDIEMRFLTLFNR